MIHFSVEENSGEPLTKGPAPPLGRTGTQYKTSASKIGHEEVRMMLTHITS